MVGMSDTERIPLVGTRTDSKLNSLRGLSIKSSDCSSIAPPVHVNDKHAEIQREIDRRKVKDGEQHGWIEHDGEQVTDWQVDEDLL